MIPFFEEAEAFDCYRSFLAKAEGTALSLWKMAATMHCLAMDLLPKISLTSSLGDVYILNMKKNYMSEQTKKEEKKKQQEN